MPEVEKEPKQKKPAKEIMTQKKELFCQAVFTGMSNKDAYTFAYKPKTTKDSNIARYSSDLAQQPIVKARLEELRATLTERNMITVEKVLEEMSHIAFDNIKNYIEFRTIPIVERDEDKEPIYDANGKPMLDYVQRVIMKDSDEIDGRSISEVKLDARGNLSFKLYPKDAALNKIGQYLGMFVEKTEISGKDGGPIEIVDARRNLVERLIKKRNETAD